MAAKSSHSTTCRKQTLEEKCKRVEFQCFISQPMHGGDLSTCHSRNITKCGPFSIVNTTHLNVKRIISNNATHAIDDIIKVHIFCHNEIYVFDLSLTDLMFSHVINFAIKDIILGFGNSISRDKNF